MDTKGVINLTLHGANPEQIERMHQIIQALFAGGVFNIRNGKVILHFDQDGILQEIKHDITAWRRNKQEPLLQKFFNNATIEIQKP